MDNKRIKVISAKVTKGGNNENGIVIDNTNKLVISAGNNTAIEIVDVQPEGSKPMTAKTMLNGHKIEIGTKVY